MVVAFASDFDGRSLFERHPSTLSAEVDDDEKQMTGEVRAAIVIAAAFVIPSVSGAQPLDGSNAPFGLRSHTGDRTELTLDTALELALRQNPRLTGARAEVDARRSLRREASRIPNPNLFVDLEGAGGAGPISGLETADLTVGLSQVLELGGDRRARTEVGVIEVEIAQLEREALQHDVIWATTKAFYEALAGQARLALADSLHQQAQRFYETVSLRVEVGKVSPLEEQRASVVRSSTAIALSRASRELSAARIRLAATWGETVPDFQVVSGRLETELSIADSLGDVLLSSPDLRRLSAETQLAQAEVWVRRSKRVPDPTLVVGGRRYGEPGVSGVTAGVSLPIPVFDRRNDAVEAARARVTVALASQKSARVDLYSRLRTLHQEARAVQEETRELRGSVLPAARSNLAAVLTGYTNGKFDLLTVLDAQRTLFESANQLVDAQLRLRTVQAAMNRITAHQGSATVGDNRKTR